MFTLPKLPYAEDALAPHISAQTMKLHHGKHHKAYVDKLNELLVGDEMADLPLEDVIARSHGLAARQTIFNNAAQSWNHDFFWKSMKPKGGGAVTGDLKVLIEHDIGDAKAFRVAFTDAATKHFGSALSPRMMPICPLCMAARRCFAAIYGNMPIISIIRTSGLILSKCS
jgi:superoxide dismutase, Fe-Mn family